MGRSSRLRLGLVGSSDAIAGEVVKVLQERKVPVDELRVMVTGSSDRRRFLFHDRELPMVEIGPSGFESLTAAVFLSSAETSHQYVAQAYRSGAIVIDSTEHMRRMPKVPLVAPGINEEALIDRPRMVAIPGAVAMAIASVTKPLDQSGGVTRIDATAILSAAGRGTAGVEELNSQIKAVTNGRSIAPHVFPHQLAFNLVPETDVFTDSDHTRDELRTVFELRKLMDNEDLQATITTVRAPIFLGDSIAARLALKERIEPDAARRLLAAAPGVKVIDDPAVSLYPQPWSAAGQDHVQVGRIRQDRGDSPALLLWISYDNVRRGIAIPSVEILERLLDLRP